MGVFRIMSSSKQQNIFKQMDVILFKAIDRFQLTEHYTSVLNFINNIPLEAKSLAAQILSICIFLIPFVLISICYFHNSDIKEKIQLKSNALELADTIIRESRELKDLKFKHIPSQDFSSEQMYNTFLIQQIQEFGIDKSDVSILSFDSSSVSSTSNSEIKKTVVEISLNFLTYNQLKLFLIKILEQKGTKITEYSLKKNDKTNLLDVKIKVQHLFSSSLGELGTIDGINE